MRFASRQPRDHDARHVRQRAHQEPDDSRQIRRDALRGGETLYQPGGEQMSIYEAAMRYVAAGVPTIVFGGEEYGTGSSRDWVAKGTALLGVKAVIARSFERSHRSNLVGMGVLPLQFIGTDSANSRRGSRARRPSISKVSSTAFNPGRM